MQKHERERGKLNEMKGHASSRNANATITVIKACGGRLNARVKTFICIYKKLLCPH